MGTGAEESVVGREAEEQRADKPGGPLARPARAARPWPESFEDLAAGGSHGGLLTDRAVALFSGGAPRGPRTTTRLVLPAFCQGAQGRA